MVVWYSVRTPYRVEHGERKGEVRRGEGKKVERGEDRKKNRITYSHTALFAILVYTKDESTFEGTLTSFFIFSVFSIYIYFTSKTK